jgi:hypothetical protein
MDSCLLENNSHTSYVLELLVAIVLWLLSPFESVSIPPFISRRTRLQGRTRRGLLPSLDIAIYSLRGTSWSFGVFRSMGRVLADPSLDLPGLCGVIPQIPTLVSSPRMLDKQVDTG